MDVERPMEFILQRQAKAENEMAAMGKLVVAGMRMVAKQGENLNKLATAQRELSAEVKGLASETRELAKAQKTTETKLQ